MIIFPGAFIFDLNGTMIDDMNYHLRTWTYVLNHELGTNLTEEEVKSQMYGKNEEVLERVFGKGHFTKAELDRISIEKEKQYQEMYKPHLKLVDGLQRFLDRSRDLGVKMAIGSAAIPFNIDFVLDNLNIRDYFSVIVSANDVEHSKPNPETYLKAASLLQISPDECIVFEDAPKGIETAANAGMKAVAITTTHEVSEFSAYKNILGFIKDYNDPLMDQLLHASEKMQQGSK
ncbi:MAG: haloacid dehalogenase [Bacteroidetes bacterium]|nr:MAG: haloacid dehalogenase [Bacteroidota bacterium]